MRMRLILLFLLFPALLTLQACASRSATSVVDEQFINDHPEMFDGYLRGATFNYSGGHSDLVNLYIRRSGRTLLLKPALYLSVGETVVLPSDSYIQITLPRQKISVDDPYTILSHGDKYLHQTRIWVKDNKVDSVVLDHKVDDSLLFFLGLGLGTGADEIEVSSFVAFPEISDSEDSVVVVNKRLKDCQSEQCADRIKAILANN